MVQVIKMVKGEPCVVQAENSQVKLHVPDGVHGTIVANVHTNHARFMHHIPEKDCLVAPVCEYHLQQPYREAALCGKYGFLIPPPLPENVKYRIEMPHIIEDVEKVRPHIRVRHGNLHSGIPPLEKHSAKTHKGKMSHNINENFVTIHTGHFSGYIVTAKGIKCCGQRAKVHLFAALRNIFEAKPLATVKVYLSSIHSNIDDFQFVSIYLTQ